MTAVEAQRLAFLYAWGPAVFEVARILVKEKILATIDSQSDGMSAEQIAHYLNWSMTSTDALLEAALTTRILEKNEQNKYILTKIGWIMLHNDMIEVDMDFMQHVNYHNFHHLQQALATNQPVGLNRQGWKNIYEALSHLPAPTRQAWLNYDHYHSDNSFDAAISIMSQNGHQHVLDVGGNTGEWALKYVQHNPQAQVTVCDLPEQITMMHQAINGQPGAERIQGLGLDLMDDNPTWPQQYDAVWISQLLMCFPQETSIRILKHVKQALRQNGKLYLMEVVWDQQRHPAAAFCQTMNSLYFIATASGNNKMLSKDELENLIHQAGMNIEAVHKDLGIGGHWMWEVINVNANDNAN